MKTRKTLLIACSLVATFTMATTTLHAASGTWTGITSSTWQVNGNWSGPSFPNGSGEIATFNGAGNGNTSISLGGGPITLGNFGVNGIVFDTFNVAAYSIGNGTINTLQGGNIVRLNSSVVNNQSVTATIVGDSQGLLNTSLNVMNLSPSARLTLGNLSTTPGATAGALSYRLQGLGDVVVAGAITDNTSGGGARLVSINNARAGTLTLSGANNFTGLINTGSGYDQNVAVSLGGTIVFDYSSGNAVIPTGMSLITGWNTGGNVVFKGNTSGSTSITLSATQRLANTYSTITVDKNGGTDTTLNLGRTWLGYNTTTGPGGVTHVDLSSGGQVRVTDGVNVGFSGGAYEVANGIIRQTGFPQGSKVTVKGANGKTYFATLDGSGYVVPQTSLTTLPGGSGSSSFSVNYEVTTNTARTTSGLGILTLRIEGASANQALDMNSRSLDVSGQILMDGANNFSINNYSNLTASSSGGIGLIVMGDGKLTLNGTKTSGDLTKFGLGLLEITGTHSGSTGSTRIFGGTLRASSANALTGGVLNMENGVLELGYNFTRALGTGAGQVRANDNEFSTSRGASMGFSAYGGDRTVNLGGASAAITFGSGGFVASRDAKFLLSSTTSDSRVDFQNPLNLAGDVQTIEVRNGTAAVDARLSGVLSNGSLNKTGAGTLELTAANTYTGTTVVAEGTLVVNGSLANTTTTIANGAVLAGVGTVGGATTISGSLQPGNSIGTLNIGNDVTWNSGNDWIFELGTAASTLALANSGSSIQDMLNITGNNDFLRGTGADVSFVFNFAGTGNIGYYKLIDWDGTTNFNSSAFAASNLSSGLTGTFTVDGSTSALYLNVIPEPHVASLLGGLGALCLLRRRR